MTDKYIIVKVRDATSELPTKPVVVNGTVVFPKSNLAKVRGAIHGVGKDQFISVADMVTHTAFMTEDESDQIALIFETAMERIRWRNRNSS